MHLWLSNCCLSPLWHSGRCTPKSMFPLHEKLEFFSIYDWSCLSFRYKSLGNTASRSRCNTFYLLCDLVQFFDLYHLEQMDEAFEVVILMKLPLLNSRYRSCKLHSRFSTVLCEPLLVLITSNRCLVC